MTPGDAPAGGIADTIPRAALVTGAARRIGRAIALDLAALGFAVAVHYRKSRDEADSLVDEIRGNGGRAEALDADLTREDETRNLIPRATEAFGPIGCLVNSASRFAMDVWDTVSRESWDSHMEINLRAPFVLSQAMAAALPSTAHGAIVNLIDQRVWNLTPYFMTYTLAKAGLWTLTQTLALALAPRIRVNAIGPGPTMKSQSQTDGQFAKQWNATPLGHGSTPGEIAAAIRFILSARAMTGQMIALDGGEHMGWAQSSKGIIPTE